MENAGPRNLGGDQEGRNHGRDADKSQELIERNHSRRPQRSIDDHRGALLACEDPIGNRRAGDRH